VPATTALRWLKTLVRKASSFAGPIRTTGGASSSSSRRKSVAALLYRGGNPRGGLTGASDRMLDKSTILSDALFQMLAEERARRDSGIVRAEPNSPIYDDLIGFKPEGLTPNAWAVLAGVSRTVWADMRRHGNPSRRTLEKLLKAAGSSLAEFEALRISRPTTANDGVGAGVADKGAPDWGSAQLTPLPQVAAFAAGLWGSRDQAIALMELRPGKLCGNLPRPASLARDGSAYAVAVVDDCMWPRFRPGRILAVSPNVPVVAGDDVLVKLKASVPTAVVPVLIKALAQRSASGVELRQFNPDVTFSVPADDIVSVEKVLGELF
jgi:hypothetical protein